MILHSDKERFALLYRLLWRLAHEPRLRNDPIDADMRCSPQMAQAVRRDMHKMKAFVRFREVGRAPGEPLHVAWFEPAHHIVEATAPFFASRFTSMRWAILTPERAPIGMTAGSGSAPARHAKTRHATINSRICG